ncbi:hypothetical protein SAMN04487895_12743 [Paenibacillus sophorae]|uniref:Uncharacterized protein n=1 Tax=Paenibacillus sophorae TaxID=1333845 RepID=A0A1H8VT11_9BACL|nr:hypothetical protein [Paenibacillus sophorae]QWU15695.1 hypothetical protein KP014_28430 [Paenibacillus sophorae]SEP18562.1 hypothetical protein SAMN04487895_12743 [Paenibacillus sophorae]
MGYLKLIMSQGNKNAELEMEAATDNHKQTAIERLMRFFGVREIEQAAAVEVKIPTIAPIQQTPITLPASDRPAERASTSGGPQFEGASEPDKPGKPPLIGSDRTLQMPIGERIGGDKPDWYETGIKLKDGVPHYRLRYWCKNQACRDKGTDYIPPDQMIVNCRKCGTAHTVRPAAPKGERDNYGNFFIADQLVDPGER